MLSRDGLRTNSCCFLARNQRQNGLSKSPSWLLRTRRHSIISALFSLITHPDSNAIMGYAVFCRQCTSPWDLTVTSRTPMSTTWWSDRSRRTQRLLKRATIQLTWLREMHAKQTWTVKVNRVYNVADVSAQRLIDRNLNVWWDGSYVIVRALFWANALKWSVHFMGIQLHHWRHLPWVALDKGVC